MTTKPTERLLLFGASGAIGGAILSAAVARGWQVTAVSRHGNPGTPANEAVRWIACSLLVVVSYVLLGRGLARGWKLEKRVYRFAE